MIFKDTFITFTTMQIFELNYVSLLITINHNISLKPHKFRYQGGWKHRNLRKRNLRVYFQCDRKISKQFIKPVSGLGGIERKILRKIDRNLRGLSVNLNFLN